MSITSALSSALMGIKATSRQAEVISSNVANATTPGYGRRSVALTALYLGGSGQGVRILGVQRHGDQVLLNDRRVAQAQAGESATRASFLSRLEGIIGTPGSGASLHDRLNRLDAALLSAVANPESEAQLTTTVQAAVALANGLNQASDQIQAERLSADKAIALSVETLNTALQQVAALNGSITAFQGSGRDISALVDQRQQLIDGIAELVPLREYPRENGQIALISASGAVLLDGKPASFGFTGVNAVVAEMSQASGALSGLTLNGGPMATAGSGSLILGGRLGSLFQIRDEVAVDAQAKLDGFARDLIQRFSDPAIDPTLSSGQPGVFTDHGFAFDAAFETGLAGRISINAALLSEQGGSETAIRTGIGATGPGASGDTTVLLALSKALAAQRPTGSASYSSGNRSALDLATSLLSSISADRVSAQRDQAFSIAKYTAISDLEVAEGVDVDTEMQSLLVIEKNYAANAKVIQTVDELLSLLLSI